MKLSSGRNLLGSLIIVEVSCGVCIITGVCRVCSLLNHILSLLLLSSAEKENQQQWGGSLILTNQMSNTTCWGQQTSGCFPFHMLSAWNRGIERYVRCRSRPCCHSLVVEKENVPSQYSVVSARREGSTGGRGAMRGIRASSLEVTSN